MVLGHSTGEFAAAVAAGVMSREDAMKLICKRSCIIAEECEVGAMAAVTESVIALAVTTQVQIQQL